ncbi:MAG TPA: hypothetical protein VFW11_17185, partial [Cyclobacteriaceae bacterium]|nr:hypothetical protein [Cyclobacteriaceae bacterium]
MKLIEPSARFIFLLVSVHVSSAQIQQPNRFEVTLRDNEPTYEVIPAESGLFLHRHLLTLQNGLLDLVRLDTSFNVSWQGTIPVDKTLLPVGKIAEGEYAYFLLRDNTSKNFELFKVNQDNGNYSQFNIKGFIRFTPTEFQVTNSALLIGGYFNRVPLVLHFSFKTLQSKVLPGLLNEDGELNQIKTFDDGSFQLLISAFNYYKKKTIWIKDYMADGTLV